MCSRRSGRILGSYSHLENQPRASTRLMAMSAVKTAKLQKVISDTCSRLRKPLPTRHESSSAPMYLAKEVAVESLDSCWEPHHEEDDGQGLQAVGHEQHWRQLADKDVNMPAVNVVKLLASTITEHLRAGNDCHIAQKDGRSERCG